MFCVWLISLSIFSRLTRVACVRISFLFTTEYYFIMCAYHLVVYSSFCSWRTRIFTRMSDSSPIPLASAPRPSPELSAVPPVATRGRTRNPSNCAVAQGCLGEAEEPGAQAFAHKVYLQNLQMTGMLAAGKQINYRITLSWRKGERSGWEGHPCNSGPTPQWR